MQCDVLVLGSGVSGIAAAVSASASGSRVVIAERDGFIGGLAGGAWVGTICGAAKCLVDSYESVLTGWPSDFVTELSERSGSTPQHTKDGLWYVPYDPTELQLLATKALSLSNVSMLVHTTLTGARAEGRAISSCRVQTSDDEVEITCRAVVDCTGESVVSRILEIPSIESPEYQAPSLVFRLSNIEAKSERELKLTLMHDLALAMRSGRLGSEFERLSVVPGSLRFGTALLKLALPGRRRSGALEVSALATAAVLLAERFRTWLARGESSLSSARVDQLAPSLGIRTGRRLAGRAVLTASHVLEGTRGENDIAIGAWPLEEWRGGSEPVMTHLGPGKTYGIPAGCVESAHMDNLYGAGRCLSADEGGIASARVIGTALQTGWAAGALAAGNALGRERGQTIRSLSLFR
jgi:hypothetical protein